MTLKLGLQRVKVANGEGRGTTYIPGTYILHLNSGRTRTRTISRCCFIPVKRIPFDHTFVSKSTQVLLLCVGGRITRQVIGIIPTDQSGTVASPFSENASRLAIDLASFFDFVLELIKL